MIEERKDEKEFDVIPASSDRNEVVRDNLQTEDGMKWFKLYFIWLSEKSHLIYKFNENVIIK